MLLLQAGNKPLRRIDDGDLLLRRGITRTHVQSEVDALEYLSSGHYDILLLDLEMPNSSGPLFITTIRRIKPKLPLFAFTTQTDLRFKVKVLDLGADDVMTTLCPIDELLARIRAVLRRLEGHATSGISFGPLEVLTDLRFVQVNNTKLQLSPTEYRFVELLVRKRGTSISKEALLSYLYTSRNEPDAKSLDVLASRVRKKFAAAGVSNILKNVWGHGYRLELDPPVARQEGYDRRAYDRANGSAANTQISSVPISDSGLS
jgi:DNA-binding response OmpR family regulator